MPHIQRGFTLIELMIVIVLTGVLLSIAIPGFSELMASNRTSAQANDFISALYTARSEAIRRGVPVCIKRLGSTEKDWTSGWEIFVDGTSAKTFSDDSKRCSTKAKDSSDKEIIIQTHDALTGNNTLKSTGTNYKTAVRFNFLGVPVDNTDTGIADMFELCRTDGSSDGKSRLISVSTTGAVSTIPHTCS